jgi:HAD superfamily hydrolase (TIGR01509 family)
LRHLLPVGRSSPQFHPGTLIPARYAAVVFDLDGVLLDTERLCGNVEARLCAAYGIDYGAEEQRAVLGLDAHHACVYYARHFGLPKSAADRLETLYNHLLSDAIRRDAQALPGALQLVGRLSAASVALGVASNARRSIVELAMRVTNVAASFEAVVAADDIAQPKPAPDPYARACELLGVPARHTLALEDTLVGARSALGAGLDCYVVSPGEAVRDPGISRTVGSLLELLGDARRVTPRRLSTGYL